MNAQKLKWIALAAFVAVVALAWGITQYMASRAEERLLDILREYGLEHRVHWQSASASLTSVTLSDVRFDLNPEDASGWHAARVKIGDLADDEDRQSITVEVEGLTAFSRARADEAVLGDVLGLPTGKANLPPLDVNMALDVRYDKDTAQASVELRQKEALNLDFDVQLTRIGALRALARTAQSKGFEAQAQLLSDLTTISIKSMDLKLEDRGMMKRNVTLYKRYNTTLTPDGGSVAAQQDKAFAQKIKTQEDACRRAPMLRTKDTEQTCRAITRFLANEKDTLHASIAPKAPVPLGQVLGQVPMIGWVFGRGQPVSAQALNLEVKS